MKSIKLAFAIILLSVSAFTTVIAQSGMVKKNAAAVSTEKTDTFLVLGNCGMCKNIIEKAAIRAGATKADWNTDTDQLTVTFEPAKTSADAIQKEVALSGYDNVGYKAPDDVYEKLHGCCHYDRSGAPGTAKSCTENQAPEN